MNALTRAKLQEPAAPGVCPAAVVVRDGRMLIGLRHYSSESSGGGLWTTPGGRSDLGETVEGAVRRETAEETGITDLEIVDYLGTVPGAAEGDTVPVFLCRSAQDPKLTEPDKFSEWRWVRPDDVPEKFINGNLLALVRKVQPT